ncbi:ankyrin-3-like [Limulus polyphemus]|uniref:Ankyrin-3-like n=1 Tax=Limulus polyphemus TaxID=6850 RepID=A0ABM1SF89_LIMPO|nr:ankyrin-3-like [Limulus polyphemus]
MGASNHKFKTDGSASFLRAARTGNIEKLLEYLKGNIDINTSNNNGLNALHLASKEGHETVVAELLKNGADVNAATKKGNTALHIAALAGQEPVVMILLQNGAKVNVQSQNGFTPLYMAAQENHDDILRLLLDNGANQSIATEDGFTPLAVALQQGHNKVVSVLLENETKGKVQLSALHIAAKKDDCRAAALLLQDDDNPDVTSVSGFTPLHITAHYGNENMALILLEKGANVNFHAKHQITPLHVAAKWGKLNMVTLLLDKGAKLEAVTRNGLAPLHMAAQGDHVDCARILLNNKAPVDDVTVDSLTALHVSAHCGHLRVAKLLLDCEADPNARALNGFTPLHIACKKNQLKVVELLLDYGASITVTTESGLTPLHVASLMGYMNIVISLIQSETNPDIQTVRGETPLHLAVRANQTGIVRILLHNGSEANARAKEEQTPLHIAARLQNANVISLLIQHGAEIDATTKEMYTALHIAAKEGQEEVASVLIEHGASLSVATKKGFIPLHLAAKYGNVKVARLLLQKNSPVDAQDNNGLTPLHIAVHYDYVNMALLLLEKGASPHSTAKNGFTPLHVATKKSQMDIATTLLEYGAKVNVESKAGFTPLHLAAQSGHTDMVTLLIEHQADVNAAAKNGLMPLHLCAQEDHVKVATILVRNGADIDPQTKAGYTPLHVASHFGQVHMVQFLLQHSAISNSTTAHGYTPLHQAAQQGHTFIITLLLEYKASPNTVTNLGQTPLSIAQQLGYVSVVEILKSITDVDILPIITMVTEEKYTAVSPEIMQEALMIDSEDEEGEDSVAGDQFMKCIAYDGTKNLNENTHIINVTKDEKLAESMALSQHIEAPVTVEKEHLPPQITIANKKPYVVEKYVPDDVNISETPVYSGKLEWKIFLVSFMVDARGGAMRGCRHSGVRIIIPPQKALMPIRITCRYLEKDNLVHPPPLMEGEALASRILEVGPSGTKFQGPVILEIPHFASLHEKEREITILRSNSGETWKEHVPPPDVNVYDVLNGCIEEDELSALEDLSANRITRIVTTDFPQYFAIITRFRREIHALDSKGGMLTSTVLPQVQAMFPEGALTKTIQVGLQVQPIPLDLVPKMMRYGVVASPIVTIEPRRRKFHKPITLTIPLPQAATNDILDQKNRYPSSLRLLCSITGSTKSFFSLSFGHYLTLVLFILLYNFLHKKYLSARFWLLDYRQSNSASKYASELYREVISVPFMAKVAVFTKQSELQVFCITDDKEENALEIHKHYIQTTECKDVEVLEGKPYYLEFFGNLVPVTNFEEQLCLTFQAFRENKLSFFVRAKDSLQDATGRIVFMREPKSGHEHLSQTPVCDLYITLPDVSKVDVEEVNDILTLKRNCDPQELEWSETDKCELDGDIIQNNSSTSTLTDQGADGTLLDSSDEVDHTDSKEVESRSSSCRESSQTTSTAPPLVGKLQMLENGAEREAGLLQSTCKLQDQE